MITTMDASADADNTEEQPTQRPTWWNLYAALAAHGDAHPGLQPVLIEQPSAKLTYQHGDIIAQLQVIPRPDRYDATVFADWVESLETVHGITAAFLYHPSDIIITAIGAFGGVRVALWTVVHGMPVNLTPAHGSPPVPVTIAQLRAFEFDQHTRGQLPAPASTTGTATVDEPPTVTPDRDA